MAYTPDQYSFNDYTSFSNSKQGELQKLLETMIAGEPPTDDTRKEIFIAFFNIYAPDSAFVFHHKYGSLSGWIWDLSDNGKQSDKPNLMLDRLLDLLSNFERIASNQTDPELKALNIKMSSAKTVYDALRKLHDHISLETIKIDKIYTQYHRQVKEAKGHHDEAQQLYAAASKQSQDTIKMTKVFMKKTNASLAQAKSFVSEVARSKAEVITVLGIFAAILIGVNGSMDIATGAFAMLSSVYIYKIVALTLLVILGLFNAIFLLLYLVAKITGRELFSVCKDSTCENYACWGVVVHGDKGVLPEDNINALAENTKSSADRCNDCNAGAVTTCTTRVNCKNRDKCCLLKRIFKRLPVVAWFNVFLMSIMAIDIVAWALRLYYWGMP